MKYKLLFPCLVLVPETPEDQSLILLLKDKRVVNNGTSIFNAGLDYSEGRREDLCLEFRDTPQSAIRNPQSP